jgi:hypothetical protein
MVFFLHSVGTALDTETALTYPLNRDGTPDLDEGTVNHLADCCDEWWNALSVDDLISVTDVNIAAISAAISATDVNIASASGGAA